MFKPSIKSPLRHLLIGFLVCTLLLGGAGISLVESPAGAGSVDDAKRKVGQIADQLEAAEEEVDRLSEELAIAVENKRQLEVEIVSTEVEIAAKQTELGGVQGQMSDLAIEAFVGGGRGGSISGLLAPGGGPNESVQRQYLTEIALNVGLASSDQLDALITDLDDLQGRLERDRADAEDLAARITQDEVTTQNEIDKLVDLNAKAERELGQALSAERARRAAAAAAAAREEAERITGGGGDGGGSSNGGGGSNPEPFDPGSVPPSSSRGAIAVAAAKSQVGVRYIKYMSREGVGFDCSGLTAWAWEQAGVSIPHQSRQQFNTTARVPIAYIEPGDLIYFYSPITHVGIYIGGGMMVDAPGPGRFVRYAAVTFSKVVGVSRPG
ncbi:MAG: NlpC/P60 family protein [Actinobacteria bacterium]|nr:NlpC/P60 family protein [Actinomycetota bacterium]